MLAQYFQLRRKSAESDRAVVERLHLRDGFLQAGEPLVAIRTADEILPLHPLQDGGICDGRVRLRTSVARHPRKNERGKNERRQNQQG